MINWDSYRAFLLLGLNWYASQTPTTIQSPSTDLLIRFIALRTAPRLMILVLLMMAFGRSGVASPGDGLPAPSPPQATPAETPIPIFLNAPTDLEAFWKKLAQPDFVVLDGDLYRKLRQAAEPLRPPRGRISGSPRVAVRDG